MNPVMMTLGAYQFGIATAAYQELTRINEYKWASQDRFSNTPTLQFVGWGGETIRLPGVIYPEYRGGLGQINAMRAQAEQATPLILIDGLGTVMGEWVIERIEERQGVFFDKGVPLRQEFTLDLRKFGTVALEPLPTSVASAAPGAGSGGAGGLTAMANTAASQAQGSIGTLTGAMNQVAAVAQQIGNTASGILAPVSRCIDIATGLQNAALDAKRVFSSTKSALAQANSVRSLLNAATSAVINAGQSAASLKQSAADVAAMPGVTGDAVRAAQGAMISANKLVVAATSAQSAASKALKDLTA